MHRWEDNITSRKDHKRKEVLNCALNSSGSELGQGEALVNKGKETYFDSM
jgi:hypothetical protein